MPDAVLYNHLAAVLGWGLCLLLCPMLLRPPQGATPAVVAAVLALGLCAAYAIWRVPAGQSASALVTVVSLAVLLRAASGARELDAGMAWAWWLAGTASVVIATVQYFAPEVADGLLIAKAATAGRAAGNLRQPNHLATALLCAMVMTTWLWQSGRLGSAKAAASLVGMTFAVALSASRTGALSLGVLVLWAALDRGLPRTARWLLALCPLIYLAFWAGLAEYAEWQHAHFYAVDRLQSASDISSSRFAIWKNTLALIAMQPWTGVGWGNFNFAWTFTPFPDRPIAFFDHTHNLPLQLAVEIGLPATAAALGLLALSFGWAVRAGRTREDDRERQRRAALAMLVVLGLHSLLEYPLWYTYFLLPAAWMLGVAVRGGAAGGAAALAGRPPRRARALQAVGALMVVGAVYAAWDHRRIEAIFAPSPEAAPLDVRIAEGRHSVLFGHHADYAAVTTQPRDETLASFRRPLHQLIDVRLLIAYIEALRASGRDEQALYAVQRLREFRREEAQAYFKDCTADNPTPPFQCNDRPVPLTWRDLEP